MLKRIMTRPQSQKQIGRLYPQVKARGIFPASVLLVLMFPFVGLAYADDDAAETTPGWYSLHIQGTSTTQGHPSFHSGIPDGSESMGSPAETATTNDITLFAGVRLGGLEIYADPEMDQGFGLSKTFGVAGYTSGEAYKVGAYDPYFQLPRLFGRTIVGLGGETQTVEDGPNQLAGSHDADNVTLTFGKFSVVDIFDNNSYAHDPRADFMNWSIIDMGAFDYAASSWGYTYGGTAEWNQSWWTLRGGLFDLSRIPNDKYLVRGFGEYQTVFEAEERHQLFDNPGKVKALFFMNSANMGSYEDALTLASQTGTIPNTALVRHWQTRPGGGINIEQQIMPDLGAFLRASMNDGTKEAYEFSEINQSLSGGLSLKGNRWKREDDTVGLGGSVNAISSEARQYLAAGGQGILIGDGQLPSYAGEQIIEAYYKATLMPGIATTADYQRVINPAYDAARGPIDFFAVRLHIEY
ncbi:MAG: carbohydrate porin [Alphaproteobacteria bacterium]